MLRDPAGGRISTDERLEQMANDGVPDDQPMHRDPEREPVHDNIDRPHITEEASSKASSDRVAGERKKGNSQEKGSQVRSLTRQAKG